MGFFEDKRKMRKRLAAMALALLMPLSLTSPLPVDAQNKGADLQRELIPLPLEYNINEGKFTLSQNASIYVDGTTEEETDELLRTGIYLANVLRKSTGYEIPVLKGTAQAGDIQLTTVNADSEMEEEGYSIESTETGITVTAYHPEGIFNGVQTLRQLFPADIEKQGVVTGVSWDVPCTTINDKPEYGFRSMQLDSVRHFLSVEQVQRQIDLASQYKINRLHLRLADDQGWRIEIDGEMYGESFEKLRTIGASTSCTSNGVSAGMYTKEDFKKIVDYAKERYVEVIPEIDMPGHSWAALVSLNFLNSTEDGKPHSGNYDNTKPYEGWDVGFSTLECRNEKTYEFIDEVIKQISEISPSKYFHIGGDEAHSTSQEDYAYFMNRVTEIAHKYGKTPIGWQHYDNVVENKENVASQYWLTDGKKLNEGVKYVVSPANYAYLDMKYDSDCEYGLTWATMNPVDDAYNWDPTNYGSKDQILGIEAPLFGETIRTNEALDYMIYPRLTGHAEIGWTPKTARNWNDYKARINFHAKRLENLGVEYRRDEKIWPKPYEEMSMVLPFEEGKGTSTTDTSGTYTGTFNGGVTWADGKYGKGVHLDGTGYIDLKLDDLKTDWTIGMWVKREATVGTNAVLISGNGGELKLDQWKNTGKVGATQFGVSDITYNYSAPMDEWVHLAFTGDSTGTSLYVNGEFVEKNSLAINGPVYRIGANKATGLESTGNVAATLDNVQIINRALTNAEIKNMMENPVDANGPIEWNLDEGEGTQILDQNDEHPGTLYGDIAWTEGHSGTALSFDGSDDRIELGMEESNNVWTIALWVNRRQTTGDNAVLFSGTQGELKLDQWNKTGKVGLTKFAVVDETFNYSAPLNEWVHLTFRSDGSSTSLYVNGELTDQVATTINAPLARIGANRKKEDGTFSGHLNAALDELKVFDRALTENEIKDLAGAEEVVEPGNEEAPYAHGPVPSDRQLQYSKDERAAFIHFGVNTFTDVEWGNGKEDPAVFNPTELDPDQWVKTFKEAGFKKVILTTKHHDGFNLFDSPGTDHDITNSAINEAVRGRDIVKEVSDACAKYGLKFGIYYSPWDQNSEHYGNDRGEDYNDFFMNALRKLLTEYGEISEVWFDGAKGSGVEQTYYFDEWFALVKELQPNALIFSDMGPDVRWIGNEAGYAGEPCWSRINGDELSLPEYDTDYLNHGDPYGTDWIMGESDTSIRGGWFFHANQSPKSLEKLADIYFNSVGKNSTLLLNVPPNKKGLIEDADIARLREFNAVLENTFKEDLAFNKTVEATTYRGDALDVDTFVPGNVTDGDYDTYWTTNNGETTGSFTIDLGEETIFDIINIQEYIPLGQRIEKFSVEVYNDNLGEWKKVSEGQTIGYKRLVRIAPVAASKVRVNILASQAVPVINNVTVHKADAAIELESDMLEGLKLIDDQNVGTGVDQIQFEGTWQDRKSEDGFINNSSHWTETAGSKATLTFKGSKFYFVSATHPNHGTFEMRIDDGEPFIVDTYGTEGFITKQIVYESEELTYGEHKVELTVTGNNPHGGRAGVHVDGFYVVDNEKGIIELAENEIFVKENAGKVEIPVKRTGGTKGELSVSFNLLSGTAIEGIDFQRMVEDVVFKEGESEGIATVNLFDNDKEDGMRSFNISISRVVGSVAGRNKTTKINIVDDETPFNLALFKNATASSQEVDYLGPDKAVDGDRNESRWASEYSDDQWLQVDLGNAYTIDKVVIKWENACGKQYKILTSLDGETYTEAAYITDGEPGLREINFEPVEARYVKVQGVERYDSRYGYSIYELEVYEHTVNKAKLETLVEEAREFDESLYTEASWSDLAKALENAETVLANTEATQEEVNEAVENLEIAMANLEKSVYTVTVNGEAVYTGAYNDKVTVKAPTVEGQTFTAWLWNGKVVSTEETYTFFLSEDMKLTASYEAVEMNAEALLTNTILTKRDTKADIKFVAQLVLPVGYTVKDAGLVWSSKEDTVLSLENTNLKPTYITRISNTNQFSVTIKGMPAGRFIRGRIFATLVDSEGNESVVYSEEARVVNK